MLPLFQGRARMGNQRPRAAHPRLSGVFVRATLALALGSVAMLLQASMMASAFAAPLATSDDWSTYLHDPGRSAASNDTALSTANAAQLARQWAYKTGGVVAASPTVAGGTVYAGSWDGYEYALDATTGALKWKTYLGITNGQ